MKERAILRDVSGEDEGKTRLDDLYEPIPGDLETLNVADARGDDETIARIARHTGLPTGSVEDILERTHGSSAPQCLRLHLVDATTSIPLPRTTSAPRRRRPRLPALFARTSLGRPAIFGSYSHKDRKFVDPVRLHLKPLERDNTLIFDSSKIKAGDKWRDNSERHRECIRRIAVRQRELPGL